MEKLDVKDERQRELHREDDLNFSFLSLSLLTPQHINTFLLATLVFSHRALKIILLKFMLFKSVYYTTPDLFPNPLLLF